MNSVFGKKLTLTIAAICDFAGNSDRLLAGMPDSMDKNRRTILLTEDEALIGFDLQDALAAAGYGIAGPASSCAEALSLLKDNEPDLAILDVMLRDGPCTVIARELQRRGVPFLVYSGDRQREAAPELRNVRWLEKPAAHQDLLRALSQMLVPPGN